jgi:hypothetical protein
VETQIRQRGFVSFLENTFENLKGKTIGLLRLDSGFYSKAVFYYLQAREKPVNYIVAARFYEPVQRIVADCRAWIVLDDGIELCELQY